MEGAPGMIRVAVVDDHPVFREGTAALLARAPDIAVIGLGGSLREARAMLDSADPPDVLILDVRLGEESGLNLLSAASRTAVILFSAFDYPQYRQAALRLGAAGFVAKSVDTSELLRSVRLAAAGKLVFDRRAEDTVPELTARELEIIRLVADGLTNDEVGTALRVTSKTVEARLGRIFARTGVQSRTELATRAIREGWLDVPNTSA
jgi:DNA-binding NarL/FixJ family response regulator